MRTKYPNILMIGGDARKSGKTSLICHLLEHYSKGYTISAVKAAIYNDKNVFREHYPEAPANDYLEIREHDPELKKDSGKFLAAGSDESWFLAATTDNKDKVVQRIMEISDEGNLLILESNVLRHSVVPGIFVMVNKVEHEQKKSATEVWEYADLSIKTGDEIFNHIERYINIENNIWNLNFKPS